MHAPCTTTLACNVQPRSLALQQRRSNNRSSPLMTTNASTLDGPRPRPKRPGESRPRAIHTVRYWRELRRKRDERRRYRANMTAADKQREKEKRRECWEKKTAEEKAIAREKHRLCQQRSRQRERMRMSTLAKNKQTQRRQRKRQKNPTARGSVVMRGGRWRE